MQAYMLADKAGRAGKWRSYDTDKAVDGSPLPRRRHVLHYDTTMLTFGVDDDGKWDGNLDTVDYSTGHGSVSDQNGMNRLFARLGMPLYFKRAGGASIDLLDGPQFRYGISRTA